MKRRLWLRIWITSLVSLAVVVALTALLWRFTAERRIEDEHDRFISALASHALPPDADRETLRASLQRIAPRHLQGAAVYSPDGELLAATGSFPEGRPHVLPTGVPHPPEVRQIPLADGRLLVLRMPGPAWHFHLGGIVLFSLIALAVGLGTYPVVRRMTRRLELLADSVERFGGGDLSARASAAGNDEVSGLADRFNRMAGRVSALLDAHGRMLANASHELRSPLARVRMALDLYEVSPRPELLASIRRDCTEIDEQIEEILLSSKLDVVAAGPPMEIIDMAAVVAEEAARLEVPFEAVHADVRGDMRLLRRLLRNLLDNAIRHGVADVTAELVDDGNGHALLRVRDRGPGLPEAERECIFEPFYRPPNAPETGTGWGLGLALVRQVAGHHGGAVRCVENPGGGCMFEVVLPLAK
ncbi:MAG: sensor histidine kinase [Arenimonas sp.]